MERVKELYTLWIPIHRKIPRAERFGIGARIDSALLDLLTSLRRATFTDAKNKIPLLEISIIKVDDIRFFFQLLWETRLVSDNQFTILGQNIESIGKMVGGWRKGIIAKTSPPWAGKKE